MSNTSDVNFIETLTSTNEESFTITLKNSIYDCLNDHDFDVSMINTVYNSKDAFGNLYKKVVIEIVQMCNVNVVDSLTKWHTLAKENDFRNGQDSTIFTNGTLLVYDSNHHMTKTYKLTDLLLESISVGNAYKNNSMIRVTLSGYMWELTYKQKESMKESKEEIKFSADSKNKKESLMIDISNIKKVVDMIKNISNLRTTIEENDELYSESFLDSLEDYYELLKQQCADFIITSLLNK